MAWREGIMSWVGPTASVLDDRGQRRGLRSDAELIAWAREAGGRRLEASARRALRDPLRGARYAALAVGALAFVLLVVVQMEAWRGMLFVVGMVSLVLSLVLTMGVWPGWTRRLMRRFAQWVGFCPCCGYDVRGLAAAGDGCVVCPECGAAWRMSGSA